VRAHSSPHHLARVAALAAILALAALALSACVVDPARQFLAAAQVYCESTGYRFEQRTNVEGEEISVCVFLDNFECDALEFMSGQCFPERTLCALQGNSVEAADPLNEDMRHAKCRFADGTACTAFDYLLYGDKCTRVRDVATCVELPGGICRTTPTPSP